jgi:hypothetical protein
MKQVENKALLATCFFAGFFLRLWRWRWHASETSVDFLWSTFRYILKDSSTLHNHRCDNLRSFLHPCDCHFGQFPPSQFFRTADSQLYRPLNGHFRLYQRRKPWRARGCTRGPKQCDWNVVNSVPNISVGASSRLSLLFRYKYVIDVVKVGIKLRNL